MEHRVQCQSQAAHGFVDVWVELQSLPLEGLLDLLEIGVPRHTKDVIVVAAAGRTDKARCLPAPVWCMPVCMYPGTITKDASCIISHMGEGGFEEQAHSHM
jgi:hypothetical protein